MRKRILSALILAPLVLAAVALGKPYWDILVIVLGVLMSWEWARLCGDGRVSPVGVCLITGVFAGLLNALLFGFSIALMFLGGAAIVVATWAAGRARGRAVWYGLGVPYVGLPCLALIWIRNLPDAGLETLLWVIGIVWATDTAAYFAGRAIGGPKLAPRISPNKTWAGLAGGVLASIAIGAAFALATSILTPWLFVLISGGLAVVEQAGDLFESWVKRRFGVKDSGTLIPGHGGVLDRVDGLLAVATSVAILTMLSDRSPLAW